MTVVRGLVRQPLNYLLLAVPVALLAELGHWPATVIFVISAVAIIPLAKLLGDATEALAVYVGPRLGGLLNATVGNAAELIITIAAIRAGLLQLVKASITGSIISNLLLIMGGAVMVGGLRNGLQHFHRPTAGLAASQLTLAVIALAIPTAFSAALEPDHHAVQLLSDSVALVMLAVYGLYLIYTLVGRGADVGHSTEHHEAAPAWGKSTAIGILLGSTVLLAWLSEVLVGSTEQAIATFGLSEFFVGIIVIPIVGNAAEHFVAITSAARNKMELSMSISLSSSMQIALFVAPLLVYISLIAGPEQLTLVFHPFELAALGASTLIATLIALDGESNWLEGAQLLAVFLIIAIAFFFLPI
ncbi:MAG: calcium/proton exchanger [Anaerolineae bacterium]